MFPKYYSVKSIVLFLSFILFLLEINAQEKDQVDTARILSNDLERMTDSLPEIPVDGENGNEVYQDSTLVSGSVYFLGKKLQARGGGPDSLEIRKLPDTVIRNRQADADFWYVNYAFQKEKKKARSESVSFADSIAFQTILWLVIIGGFAAFVIIYLANSNVGLFRKGNKSIAGNEEVEVETDNIFEINYQREIDKAIQNGNYRFAVRLMFLRILKNLSDKKVIQYKQDRTNFDYLMQLHSTKYYGDFFRLTRNYEYSWYGQFTIEPENFSIIKNDFENFDRSLNNR
ncbi:MAG: hypothetical protein ACHQFX_07100 [Chitinophagales bacterium]